MRALSMFCAMALFAAASPAHANSRYQPSRVISSRSTMVSFASGARELRTSVVRFLQKQGYSGARTAKLGKIRTFTTTDKNGDRRQVSGIQVQLQGHNGTKKLEVWASGFTNAHKAISHAEKTGSRYDMFLKKPYGFH